MTCVFFICLKLNLWRNGWNYSRRKKQISCTSCDGGGKCLLSSERREEAVERRHDVVGVVAVDEALPTVVDEPAVNVWAASLITPVVLLPAPDTHTQTHKETHTPHACTSDFKRVTWNTFSFFLLPRCHVTRTWWRAAGCPSPPWSPPSSGGRLPRGRRARSLQALWRTDLWHHTHTNTHTSS